MKITYNNQTIDFFDFDLPDKVVISLSGGCDSAALTYLIAKHYPEIEISPFTCDDLNAPLEAKAAIEIVTWLQNKFPKNKINDTAVFPFNDCTEDFVSEIECWAAKKTNPRFTNLSIKKISKIIQIGNIATNYLKQNPKALRVDGMTLNPPVSEMKKYGFYEKAERRRDKGASKPTLFYIGDDEKNDERYTNWIYQAWANVDKKFIADIFKQNNLMESLFPMTRSCVGTAKQTDNYTRECHSCFWCHEKKWAFDLVWKEN